MTDPSDLALRTRQFVRDVVLPIEDLNHGDVEAAGGDSLRRELQAEARARGLLSPQAPRDLGGLGLGMVERSSVLEEAGWSLFGAMAINAAAPDEGNIHLLDQVSTEEAAGIQAALAGPFVAASADVSYFIRASTADGPIDTAGVLGTS